MAGSPAPVIGQYAVSDHTPWWADQDQRLQATFELGNPSSTRQRVTVTLRNAEGSDFTNCVVWLNPNTPRAVYAMAGYAGVAWSNVGFALAPVTTPTTGHWLQLDNVDVRRTNRTILGTECFEPGSFELDALGFLIDEYPAAPAPEPEPEMDALAVDAGSDLIGDARSGELAVAPNAETDREGYVGRPELGGGEGEPSAGSPGSNVGRSGLWSGDRLARSSDTVRTDPITVTISGTGAGTVTSNPAGLTCSGTNVTCTGWFAEGVTVTLTATPEAGFSLVNWNGACTGTTTCQVTVIGPKTVTAAFGTPLHFYHLDVLGSVRMVTDAAGAVVKRHDYFAFGEDTAALTGDPRRFTGKELDPETALHYFGARYHRNLIGRFTSVDPVLDDQAASVDPQRWNRYGYARQSPLSYVDPHGLEVQVLDSTAFEFILGTLPEELRQYVVLKGALIDLETLSKAKTKDANFLALVRLVSDPRRVRVYTSQEAQYCQGPCTARDGSSNVTTQPFYYSPTSSFTGIFVEPVVRSNPNHTTTWRSVSGDAEVIVMRSSAASELEKHRTLAHELYGRAYLYFSGQRYTHPSADKFIAAVEGRVRR